MPPKENYCNGTILKFPCYCTLNAGPYQIQLGSRPTFKSIFHLLHTHTKINMLFYFFTNFQYRVVHASLLTNASYLTIGCLHSALQCDLHSSPHTDKVFTLEITFTVKSSSLSHLTLIELMRYTSILPACKNTLLHVQYIYFSVLDCKTQTMQDICNKGTRFLPSPPNVKN